MSNPPNVSILIETRPAARGGRVGIAEEAADDGRCFSFSYLYFIIDFWIIQILDVIEKCKYKVVVLRVYRRFDKNCCFLQWNTVTYRSNSRSTKAISHDKMVVVIGERLMRRERIQTR